MRPKIALTIADVAESLGRSKSAVRELIANGDFPEGTEVNGRQVWSDDDLLWFKMMIGGIKARLKPEPARIDRNRTVSTGKKSVD